MHKGRQASPNPDSYYLKNLQSLQETYLEGNKLIDPFVNWKWNLEKIGQLQNGY
jgi:hypothetical protein